MAWVRRRHLLIARLLALCVAFLACTTFTADAAESSPAYVTTKTGKVQGVATGNLRYFKGVPYAATTGGDNRWQAPKPRAPWSGVFNATVLGPGCFQTHHNPDVPKVLSEDCLNINVWTPSWANETSNLPVGIFFHGGSYAEGSDQGPFHMYDGSYFASTKPMIVCTANYRLGALGWLAVGSLTGNYGFLDQQFALKWVQENIAAFGGDPSRVTLWGESAGAGSVGLHLISPSSKGLFHQAIMESNPSGLPYRSLKDMTLYGQDFCKIVNCSQGTTGCDIGCMREAPLDTIRTGWDKAGNDVVAILLGNPLIVGAFLDFTPIVDGTVIPMDPYQAWKTGAFDRSIPLLLGTNENEGATFIYAGFHSPLPTFLFDLANDVVFGKNSSAVKDYYKSIRPDSWSDGRAYFSRIFTDFLFRCSSEAFANGAALAGTNAFVYHYNHVFSDSSIFTKFGLPSVCLNDTCHASELPFVFHASTNPGILAQNVTFDADELVMEQRFADYWGSFIMHGNPNTGNQQPVTWPRWSPLNRTSLLMKTPLPSTDTSVKLCSFWDHIGYDY